MCCAGVAGATACLEVNHEVERRLEVSHEASGQWGDRSVAAGAEWVCVRLGGGR